MPDGRFSGFVHYLGEVVGWQLGKWDLGGNIFVCECKYSCGKGLGRGIILEKLVGRKFCCPGFWHFGFEQEEQRKQRGERVNCEG